MTGISQTLNCSEICKNRTLKGLPVYNAGLGANIIKQPEFYISSLQYYSDKREYTSASGIPDLQNIIKDLFSTKNYSVENVLVGNGLKELIYILQLSFKGKIIHITPSWVSYKEQINILNRKDDLIEIETKISDNFKIDIEKLDQILEKNSKYNKLLLLNNPNNPTGLIYSKEQIINISKILKKHNCIVLADEIYFNLTHFNEISSISDYLPDLTIRGSSVSKDLGCGGYRVGWITFPKNLKSLFNICMANSSSIYSCAPVPIQYATSEMLKNKVLFKKHCDLNNKVYKLIVKRTCNILSNSNLIYIYPEAAWYMVLDFSNYKEKLNKLGINDSIELSNYLIKNIGLVSVAGKYFNIDTLSIRISLISINNYSIDNRGNITEETIFSHMEEGFNKLIIFVNNL
jgi:aspartate aminotransferase